MYTLSLFGCQVLGRLVCLVEVFGHEVGDAFSCVFFDPFVGGSGDGAVVVFLDLLFAGVAEEMRCGACCVSVAVDVVVEVSGA